MSIELTKHTYKNWFKNQMRLFQKVQKFKEPSTVDGELMSHEQLKQKEEHDKMIAIANAHKKRVRDQLAELTIEYTKLIKAYVS